MRFFETALRAVLINGLIRIDSGPNILRSYFCHWGTGWGWDVGDLGSWVRLPWLTHDEASGPYTTIPQYRYNKIKQHTHTHTHTHPTEHQKLGFDWCCFYYFVRKSLVALLEALCARKYMTDFQVCRGGSFSKEGVGNNCSGSINAHVHIWQKCRKTVICQPKTNIQIKCGIKTNLLECPLFSVRLVPYMEAINN